MDAARAGGQQGAADASHEERALHRVLPDYRQTRATDYRVVYALQVNKCHSYMFTCIYDRASSKYIPYFLFSFFF